MIEFRRNIETGILEVWKNGEKIGVMITMGDNIEPTKIKNNNSSEEQDV